jgi:hypothetical protein
LVLAILPNVVGSVVNVVYNTLIIVDKNPAQQASFEWLILAYNVVVYPVLALVAIVVIRRAYQGWRRLREPGKPSTEESALSRRRVLASPLASCTIIFPTKPN